MSISGSQKQLGRQLLSAHIIALMFPLVVIIKNWIVFGSPSVATGTGAALYFGSHPLTGGYEAAYYSLDYDIGAVAQGLDHLSVEGDKLLKAVAIFMLKQQSFSDIFSLYFQKAFAFIFTTKAVLADSIWNERSLRIVEVILTTIGLFHVRKPLLRWFLGGALCYQILVHIPLLYNPRYSVGALEVPLLLLAGVGAAGLLTEWNTKRRSALEIAGVAALLIAAVGAGDLHRRYSQALMPDILSVPHAEVYQWPATQLAALTGNGLIAEGGGRYVATEAQWSMDLPVPDLTLAKGNELYVYSINLTAKTDSFWKSCGDTAAYYMDHGGPEFSEARSRHFRIVADGAPHFYHLSATYQRSPLYPNTAGVLRIAGNCPQNSHLQLNSITLSKSSAGRVYREEYLRQAK